MIACRMQAAEQNFPDLSAEQLLQDLESGRPMELEAIVGAVVELGEKMGLSLPSPKA